MEIKFIPHAQRKFKLLEKYGFFITEEKVMAIVKTPERVIHGKKGRWIAQSRINDNHVLRVVFAIIGTAFRCNNRIFNNRDRDFQ